MVEVDHACQLLIGIYYVDKLGLFLADVVAAVAVAVVAEVKDSIGATVVAAIAVVDNDDGGPTGALQLAWL